jgi:muramoyltetrapeptide carboxypeptidase
MSRVLSPSPSKGEPLKGYLSLPLSPPRTASALVPARKLAPRATLGLFSPSEPLTPGRLSTLRRSLDIAIAHGFRFTYARNALKEGPYSAGTATDRLADIHELAADPSVDALFATWGGKSCNQLLAGLDFDLLLRERKPIIGFSDVAVLLNALTATTGLTSFHFLVAGRLNETTHSGLGLLLGNDTTHADIFDFKSQPTRAVLCEGQARGRLFGGNLSTLVLGLLGTDFMPFAKDVVFFWESASERPQIIDQHLTALRNAGFFEHVRAMIVGSVYSSGEVPLTEIRQAISFAVDGYEFPIVYAPSFGHLPTQNPIVPIGALCEVDTTTFTVRLREEVVR